jgi:hypothetical protein
MFLDTITFIKLSSGSADDFRNKYSLRVSQNASRFWSDDIPDLANVAIDNRNQMNHGGV